MLPSLRFFPSLCILGVSLLVPFTLWRNDAIYSSIFRPQAETPSSDLTCPQVSPIFPVVHAALDQHLNTLYGTHEFRLYASDVLGGAIRIPTESYDNLLPVGQDERWNVFRDFHDFLESSFPRIYLSLQVTRVNTYGLVFHWQGSDTKLKPILLASHQDVVPVDPTTIDQWIHSPYSGYYDGTWVWGRGSVDDKADLISQLITIDTLLESEFKPKRTIVIAVGIDEEATGTEGAGKLALYLEAKYGKDGFSLLLDEGEGYGENAKNGTIFAAPQLSEKGYIDVRIEVLSPGGHSSVPPVHTSIGLLSLSVVALEKQPHVAEFRRTGTAFVSAQCNVKYEDYPSQLKDLARLATVDDKSLLEFRDALISVNPFFGVMLRTTQAVDLVEGGVKVNALPEKASVVINHRIAEHSSVTEVKNHIISTVSPIAAEYGLALSAFGENVSGPMHIQHQNQSRIILSEAFQSALEPSPVTPAVLDGPYGVLSGTIKATLESSQRYEAERVVVAPSLALGNTDTRFYWNLTRHIFRYSHRGDRDDMYNGLHTVNEAVRADSLVEQIRFFTKLILNCDETQTL
ncbi:carboxypeptidase S [Dendrothele bispora CBS 962.96]|uniref:Carboxypeptidase S n=1 Tax=Dendrothele bispora (strain CBS 962.96) TaxID=1314807 RepID=A0A4V4HGK7_DENBC|nr:carboxypeptidase S [Dendrothele bispora CBS 962.96]